MTKNSNKQSTGAAPPPARCEFPRPTAAKVWVAGKFSDWRPEATPIVPVGEHRWLKELILPLGLTAQMGILVSTTHTITGAIIGVGSTKRLSAARWGAAADVVLAWITTIPACASSSALILWALQALDLPSLR